MDEKQRYTGYYEDVTAGRYIQRKMTKWKRQHMKKKSMY